MAHPLTLPIARRPDGEERGAPLSRLDVLAVDCQATAASPRGHLIELGWGRVGPRGTTLQTRLIGLPDGVRLSPAVARVTGISESALHEGVVAGAAWRALVADASCLGSQPVPAVAHFARFERPFLSALSGGALPLDLVCTHEIARRLLPHLPRRSLRALTGYFGRGVGPLRRSGDHVAATMFVWGELARLLEDEGITSWDQLRWWLATPVGASRRRARVWPMPRDLRLSLPRAPGAYRMLRTSGDVLYVGKATSLHDRVNSYFRQQHGVSDRMLEMLSQARGLSFEVTPSALEAALLEANEIKRHCPPYNVALAEGDREVWFASRDLTARAPRASARHPVGPFPSAWPLDQFAALVRGSRDAVAHGRWGPSAEVYEAGLAQLHAAHIELARHDLAPHARLLRLGARLWREGHRDRAHDTGEIVGTGERHETGADWTPDRVKAALERVALRASLAVRRARWMTRLVEASIAWSEPGFDGARLIVLEHGECALLQWAPAGSFPPVPPGHRRSAEARRGAFTVARFDRLRVLLTELKRLVADGAPVSIRLGAGPPVTGARLARVLAWL